MSITEFSEDTNLIIIEIKKLSEVDLKDYITQLPNGDYYPTTGMRTIWRSEIIRQVKDIINYYDYFSKASLNFHALSFYQFFKELLTILNNVFTALTHTELMNDFHTNHQRFSEFARKFEELKTLPLTYTPKLTDTAFDNILTEVRLLDSKFDFDDQITTMYRNSEKIKKAEIFENVINVRNILTKRNPTLQDGISYKESFDKIYSHQSQVEDVQDLVTEAKEIVRDVKSNITKNNTGNISQTFSTLSRDLKDEIASLNKWIIALFCSIMIMFSIKAILILFFEDKFKDIYNFILFLSLILSCSALLAYFIKERNHLRNLHDFYEMKGLELSALPDYMNELSRQERNELTIQLAPSYFIGQKDLSSSQRTTLETSTEMNKVVSELTKIISDIKSLKP